MKKKITAFIIGAAIWFGMADAARQMDSLQSGASDLVAKTSMFLFSLGREANAPAPDRNKTSEPFNAASTENALTAETNIRKAANPKVSAKTNVAAKQENVVAENHSEEATFEPNDTIARVKDVNALVALADEIDVDVHSQEEARVNALASLNAAKDNDIRQRAIGRKVAAAQRMAVEAGKRYEVRYSFEVDGKATKSTMPAAAPKSSVPCPPLVSPDVRKLKTVLLVPEVMKQFGE